MPTAVSTLVALELVDRLEDITLLNGYGFDVESVTRVSRNARGWTPRSFSIVVEDAGETPNEELSYPGNPPAVAHDVAFSIHGFYQLSDDSTLTSENAEQLIASSIIEAIRSDGTDWYTFNDNAINAEITSVEPFDSGTGDHAGVTVGLTVTYRVSESDPFTVRG